MQDKLFYTLAGGFIIGIFLRSFFNWGWPVIFFLLIIAAAIFLYAMLSKGASRRILVLAALFLITFNLGLLRFHISDEGRSDPVLEEHVGERIVAEGIVSDEPDLRESYLRLVIDLDTLWLTPRAQINADKKVVDVRVLVSTEFYPRFSYGDRVLVKGKLEKPQNFKTDSGKEFDYISYLAKDRIFYQIPFAKVELISSGHGNFIRRNLFTLKRSFLQNLSRVIPEPESALMGGLLLGTKQSLGKELKQKFIDTGIIHIVVLSGYNITIVADAIRRVFNSFLPLVFGFWFGVFAIVLFAVMTGAGATIVRASIMAILVLLAHRIGRTYEITRALTLAGLLMIIHNPWVLVFDISFQLSFLATVGLIYLAPRFEKYVHFLPKVFDLRGIFAATIATQFFVLPYILWKMGTLSIVSPIVNLLVLPFVPFTMFFGFVTGILGFLAQAISLPFSWITYGLLHYQTSLVNFFAGLPFAAIAAKSFPLILVILIYALIAWFVLRRESKLKPSKSI